MSTPTEREFSFNNFKYAAKQWGSETGHPVLALHGWLDNCGSFDPLAALLPELNLLAPDLAGHGFSDHRPGYADYPIWSELAELGEMADQMGWEQFALVGHSRGAMMALILAAMMPERVTHLVLIDAITLSSMDVDEIWGRIQDNIFRTSLSLGSTTYFPSYDIAIKARCESPYGAIGKHTAETLAKRGLSETASGFYWHADPKLKVLPAMTFSEEQVLALSERIQAPALALIAGKGWLSEVQAGSKLHTLSHQIIDKLSIAVESFDDGHFLHMESAAPAVAQSIKGFIES